MLQSRAGHSHLDHSLCEVLVVVLQPFNMSVMMLDLNCFSHKASNSLQALLWEVASDQLCKRVLVAALKCDWQLLNNGPHIVQGFVEFASSQVVVQLLNYQRKPVSSLCAFSFVLNFAQVLLSQEWALLLHLSLVDSLKHCRVFVKANVHKRICFSFFYWSSA